MVSQVLIRWIVIYPVDSGIQRLNNQGQNNWGQNANVHLYCQQFVGIIYFMSFWKDDEDTRTTAKEITLEEMHSAAVEVDGTGTVDQSSSAAERLQHNQTTSSTVENSHEQVH